MWALVFESVALFAVSFAVTAYFLRDKTPQSPGVLPTKEAPSLQPSQGQSADLCVPKIRFDVDAGNGRGNLAT
jgi:hypothetical protein